MRRPALVFALLASVAAGGVGKRQCEEFGHLMGNATGCCTDAGPPSDMVICNEMKDDTLVGEDMVAFTSEDTKESCPKVKKVRTFPLFGSSFQTHEAIIIDQTSRRQLVEQRFCDEDFCRGLAGRCIQAYSGVEMAVRLAGTNTKANILVATGCACRHEEATGQLVLGRNNARGDVLRTYKGCQGIGSKENRLCIFPFRYRGRLFHACTNVDVSRPWCRTRTDADVSPVEGRFGYCTDQCPTVGKNCRTIRPGPVVNAYCVFPFRYKGVKYYNCTTVDHTHPWCATRTDFFGNLVIRQWGRCSCRNATTSTAATDSTTMESTTMMATSTMMTTTMMTTTMMTTTMMTTTMMTTTMMTTTMMTTTMMTTTMMTTTMMTTTMMTMPSTTMTTQPSDCRATCTSLCGSNSVAGLPGSNPCYHQDITFLGAGPVSPGTSQNPEACQSSCAQSDTCLQFTWQPAPRLCNFKTGTVLALRSVGVVSGPKTCRSDCGRVGVRYDSAREPLGVRTGISSLMECQCLCVAMTGCEFVTFHGSDSGRCVLLPMLDFGTPVTSDLSTVMAPRCCCGQP